MSLQEALTEIQNLVSCPSRIYSQLYLATLSEFIIHCPASLLDERLKLTITVLKLRQGILLPKNACAEIISAEEAQWTYALFSAALLRGFSECLLKAIIPKVAENWLIKNDSLYTQWKLSLLGKKENDIYPVIQKALEKKI